MRLGKKVSTFGRGKASLSQSASLAQTAAHSRSHSQLASFRRAKPPEEEEEEGKATEETRTESAMEVTQDRSAERAMDTESSGMEWEAGAEVQRMVKSLHFRKSRVGGGGGGEGCEEVETTPRYIKICSRVVDRKKIEEIYDYFKMMDRGGKGYISLAGGRG